MTDEFGTGPRKSGPVNQVGERAAENAPTRCRRNTDAIQTGRNATMTKITTSHVGSLPRTQEVVDFIFARENEKPYDPAAFDACMTAAVSETVKKQVDASVDIVSDGETSKISYATYVKDRYPGFSGDSPRNAPADLKMFPGFLQRLADDGGTPQYARPMCTGEVRSKGQDELLKDINNLKTAMAQHGAERGFMNAASPGVISLFLQNEYYPNRETYLAALADAMKEEYETIIANGLDLQLDCPDLALSRHMLFTDLSDDEFLNIANMHVEALNHALRDVPQDRVRVHICWGNYEGPHCCDIPRDKVFSTLMSTKARYVLFETSNPRHAHEWTVFRDRKSEIPDDKILVPGVVDTTTNFVEHPELVAQRIERFTGIVGADRVIAGSDCGFGTFAGFGAVDPDIAYAKLAALSEGAALASSRQ
jgi:5-methyltetrahydropteroyltriglutamate--homocysteine methyltransferase